MELTIQGSNLCCPICRRPFKPATNIVRLKCYHCLHLECMHEANDQRCPLCYVEWNEHEAVGHDSDDEAAVSSGIEQLFRKGVSLHDIKSQGLAATLEALKDYGLRRSHFVRYPALVNGESLARYPDITSAKLLAYFGLTREDAKALFTDDQLVTYGYKKSR